MGLALYRRHRRECKAGHQEELRSSEYDERRKGWKRCDCPIVVSGTLARRFRRHPTGHWEWEPAHAVADTLERQGSWTAPVPVAPQPEESARTRIKVEDASAAFLAKCTNRNIASNTLAKYRTFTNQLEAYCQDRGCVYIDQLTVTDMDRFYARWKDGIRAKAKKLERLKAFVKFCVKREWLAKDIADDLEAPEGSSVTVPKSPFTDEELDRLYAACVSRNAKQLCDIWRNKRLKKIFELSGPWETPAHPHKFRHAFVRILLEKGVPVPDVAELIGDSEQILRKRRSFPGIRRWLSPCREHSSDCSAIRLVRGDQKLRQ